jgi:hypothetical protein
MSEAVVIDLGEAWSVVEERRAGERPRPARRAALAALLLLVVLLLAGGSAVTTSPFTPLASIDVAGRPAIEVGGGGVFVAGGTGAALFVARYALDTGAMTWKIAVSDRPDALTYLAGAAVVTVWFSAQTGANRVTVLDAATGARLWELPGALYSPPTPDAKQALTVAGDPNAPGQMSYTDLRTGRAIWTRPVPAGAQIVTTDTRTRSDAAGFVVAAPDGTVTLLARDTGAVLGSAKVARLVPDNAPTLNPEDIATINVSGGQLLVARRTGTPNGEIASYDLPGLTLRWVRSGLMPGYYPWPCGPNLCLSGFTGGMTALDPATGASRWTTEDWQADGDLGGGRMLAFRDGGLDHAGILDSTTGQLLGDLGNWTVVSGPDIHLATEPVRGNVRSTWIGVVDPGRAAVRPVGKLDGLSTGGCISRADLLVCRTLDAKVRVWSYHPDQ